MNNILDKKANQFNGMDVPPIRMPEARTDSVVFPTDDDSIRITPGAVIGALTAATLINKNKKNENVQLPYKPVAPKKPSIDGNYYSQVKNICDNLHIVFTPISAIFVVKNGTRDFTLDTIEVSEMNTDMKLAWQKRDENYFKNLMTNKMHSEMQLAEQGFARKFLEKQLNITNNTKHASEDVNIDEMSNVDVMMKSVLSKGIYNNLGEVREVIAEAICDEIEKECSDYTMNLKLDRPFDKYAGFITSLKDTFGLHSNETDVKSLKKKLNDINYVNKNVKVGFLPDRVIYTVDNQLVSTLSLIDMNEDGYEHFNNQNSKYFKNVFVNEVKKNVSESPKITIEKMASADMVDDLRNIFYRNDIHPVIYHLVLTSKYGLGWFSFMPESLMITIQKDFGLVEEIGDIPLNKILSVQIANKSMTIFESAFAFEKIINSFCNKPIDFFQKQEDFIDISDIIFTVDILDRVTPLDDIYDNFSPEVITFICNILAKSGIFVYYPTAIISSPLEPAFQDIINENLIKYLKRNYIKDLDNPVEENIINDKIEYISNISFTILKSVRRFMQSNRLDVNRDDLISNMMNKIGVREDLMEIVKEQAIINLAVDDVLLDRENMLKEQMDILGIKRPEGMEVIE